MCCSAFRPRTTCPACGAASASSIGSWSYSEPPVSLYLERFYHDWGLRQAESIEGAAYELARCRGCGLVYQVQVPDDDLARQIQDEWIDPDLEQARLESDGLLAYHAEHAQDVMQVLSLLGKAKETARVLDFGMGWGHWALMAKAFGCQVYGCELSQWCVDHGRALGITMVEWSDIPALSLDYVSTWNVFEHLSEPLETLRHLREGLGQGGLIRIRVPTAHDIERRLAKMNWFAAKDDRDAINPVAPLEHLNCFSRESLRQMAAQSGMRLTTMPARAHYGHLVDWSTPGKVLRNIVRPVYRDLLKRQNDVLLERADRT